MPGLVFQAMPPTFPPEHFPLELRTRMFEAMLSSALHVADLSRPERLIVHSHQNHIRVLVGRLIVVTAGDHGLIWIATNPDTLAGSESGLQSWKRDVPGNIPTRATAKPYPEYKRPPSVNGYYVPEMDPDGVEWSVLRKAHFRYLDLAVERGPAADPRSVQRILEELASLLGTPDVGPLWLCVTQSSSVPRLTARRDLPVHRSSRPDRGQR